MLLAFILCDLAIFNYLTINKTIATISQGCVNQASLLYMGLYLADAKVV